MTSADSNSFLVGEDGIFHYSYSTLGDQARCPARNYFKKLARKNDIQTDISLPAIFGSAVHHGIEKRLKDGDNAFEKAKDYLESELEGSSVKTSDKDYQDKYSLMDKCINNFENYFYESLKKTLTDPQSQVELRLETPFRKGILVGKIDIALPEILADWKTGKPPYNPSELAMSPQAGFYWYLAQKSGLQPPKEFVYVYLQGQNLAKKVSKTGKVTADRENKMMKFSFPTYPTESWVESLFKNQIVPLAKAYESGIIYKNPSVQNCSSCSYRTVCPDFELPVIVD